MPLWLLPRIQAIAQNENLNKILSKRDRKFIKNNQKHLVSQLQIVFPKNSIPTWQQSILLQRYIPKYFLFSVRLNLASSYKQLNNKNKHTYRLVGYQTIIISLQPVTELFSKIKHSRNITKSVTVTCTSTSSTLLLVTNKQQFRIKTSLDLEHSDELNSTVNWFCFMFQVVPDLILLFSVW